MDERESPSSPEATVEALHALVVAREAKAPSPTEFNAFDRAIEILARCANGIPAEAPALVARLLSDEDVGRAHPASLVGLGMVCGEPWTSTMAGRAKSLLEGSPLARAEIDAMLGLSTMQAVLAAHQAVRWQYSLDDSDPQQCTELAGNPAFARMALSMARLRLEDIHSGKTPYKADKAFTVAEGQLLGRIVAAAFDRNDKDVLNDVQAIWPLAAVAPDTSSTMPSQSVTIALARAVESRPSPASVSLMRDVAGALRHKGLKKKLGRLYRSAERRLVHQPDLITRLPPGEPIPKWLLPGVRRSFEQLYRVPTAIPGPEWQARFMSQKEVRSLSECLIWRVAGAQGRDFSARPHIVQSQLVWRLADGDLVPAEPGERVMLWHPLSATPEEREAWRDHVIEQRVVQPFLQAFRQYYRPLEELDETYTTMFAGYRIAIKPFLGVAEREGWQITPYTALTQSSGGLRFLLYGNCNFFPGMTGDTTTAALEVCDPVSHRTELKAIPLREVESVLLSEVLRSVDLMTSVGAFAYRDEKAATGESGSPTDAAAVDIPGRKQPGQSSAEMRREVLRRLYRGRDGTGPRVEARHLIVGDHAIHIATGRITRHGDPIEIDPPQKSGSVVWMPYQDEILGRIIRTTAALDGRS